MEMDPTYSEIREVKSRHDLRLFIDFPRKLYRNDAGFVFEPFNLQREFLSAKNPFFTHSSARYYLALRRGDVVGRIASIINTAHNKKYNEQCGFFGFFECIDDVQVAGALLNAVISDHRKSGFSRVYGPASFTTNDSAGLLIEGFGTPPVVMMLYNKAYYADYLTANGFRKVIDLFSYFIDDSRLGSLRTKELSDRLLTKLSLKGITFRNVDFNNYERELRSVCPIHNESNKDNWGFIPLTEEEFIHTGQQFRQFVPNDLMILAVKEEEVVGFIVALPDLNQVFRHIPSGRMLPFGFLKFLVYKQRINRARILILGVKDSLRRTGIDLVLYKKIQENLAGHRIYSGEACYVLENNTVMHSIMKKLGARPVKKYRMYSAEIKKPPTDL